MPCRVCTTMASSVTSALTPTGITVATKCLASMRYRVGVGFTSNRSTANLEAMTHPKALRLSATWPYPPTRASGLNRRLLANHVDAKSFAVSLDWPGFVAHEFGE